MRTFDCAQSDDSVLLYHDQPCILLINGAVHRKNISGLYGFHSKFGMQEVLNIEVDLCVT